MHGRELDVVVHSGWSTIDIGVEDNWIQVIPVHQGINCSTASELQLMGQG
jgi:hypothetical protein